MQVKIFYNSSGEIHYVTKNMYELYKAENTKILDLDENEVNDIIFSRWDDTSFAYYIDILVDKLKKKKKYYAVYDPTTGLIKVVNKGDIISGQHVIGLDEKPGKYHKVANDELVEMTAQEKITHDAYLEGKEQSELKELAASLYTDIYVLDAVYNNNETSNKVKPTINEQKTSKQVMLTNVLKDIK